MNKTEKILLGLIVLVVIIAAGMWFGDADLEIQAMEREAQSLRDAHLQAKFCAHRPALCKAENEK